MFSSKRALPAGSIALDSITVLLIDDYLLYKLLIEPPVTIGWIVCESIRDMCNRELTDEGVIHEKILELQLRHELDEITEEEYQKEEANLMARLRKIREAKQKEMWGDDTDKSEEPAKRYKEKNPSNKKKIGEEENSKKEYI